jgi:hypothetical protein
MASEILTKKGGDVVKSLAFFVTAVAAAMAAMAAWDRGGTIIDKLLLVSLSIIIVLAVHLLPSLSRRPAAGLVWSGCLLCAIYGHLTFMTHANLRAGDIRANQSMLAIATERQIEITRTSLSSIQARPVAVVATEIAKSNNWRERAALNIEIAEGKRAEKLMDAMAQLSEVATTAQRIESADPVIARLCKATGLSEDTVTVVIGLTFSILLELIGALLWFEVLRKREYEVIQSPQKTIDDKPPETEITNNNQAIKYDITDNSSAVTGDMTVVTAAIKQGKCKPTVAGIREFIGCSQTRAMELRRAIKSHHIEAQADLL